MRSESPRVMRRRRAQTPATGRGFVTTVHARGAASLDGMLALTDIASGEGAPEEVLARLTRGIASLLGVDVCSIYLCDDEGELVLRATHGFPQEVVGTVRMRVGEGLTGFAVECMRPVSVAHVTADARNKRFEGLGEERFPALCALPLVDGGRAVGALVVQRRQPRAFGPKEIVLVAAMAPPVLLTLERARARRAHAMIPEAARPGRPQEVTLRGAGAAPGRALGVVAVRRARLAHAGARAGDVAAERAALGRAFADVAAEVARLDGWARPRLGGEARARLPAIRFLLEDARLRERAFAHVAAGIAATAAMERVAREYVRVMGEAHDDVLRERAHELEGLCARVLASLAGDGRELAPGSVLVAGRLGVLEAIELAVSHGAGAALAAPAHACPGVQVARALGVPVVCDVRALFQWAADGDRALLDGDAGTLVLNPTRGEIAAHRRRA